MPEMKRNFTKGKMNKDLDERLVPNGEYRDAMNVQVSTSEGSDVGTIQNVLGNTPGCQYVGPNPILAGSSTVGSVSDEKNDSLYWLVAGPIDDGSYLPLTLGDTISFKDMIMRTNSLSASGCEPVFVDKYGWCIGVVPGAGIVNSLAIDPTEMSNVTTGMNVTGYNGAASVFGPTLVTSVGTLNNLTPITYYQGSTMQITPPVTSAPTDFYLRTFEDPNNAGKFSKIHDHGVANSADGVPGLDVNGGVQTNLIQLIPIGFPNEIQVGSIINAGAFFMGGVITNITQSVVCAYASDIPAGGSCASTFVVTVDLTNASSFDNTFPSPSIPPFGPPNWNSEMVAYGSPTVVGATVDFDPADIPVPNNVIYVLPGSFQWLDEVYNILWDAPGALSGAELRIDPSVGGGINFPADTCIDPNSVINVVDGFNPPISYDYKFDLIGCQLLADGSVNGNAGNLVNALNYNPKNRPLSFITSPADGIEAIFLNGNVSLSNSDTYCFTSERVLEFNFNNLVTGINIIDDLLFWTDNFTEPKKINIPRSVSGTDLLGDTHTAVVNDATGLSLFNYNPIRKEHITVIRKSPKNALDLELDSGVDFSLTTSGITNIAVNPDFTGNINESSIIEINGANGLWNFSSLSVGSTMKIEIETDIEFQEDFTLAWNVGDVLLLKEFDQDSIGNQIAPLIPLKNHAIRGVIKDWQLTSFVNDTSLQDAGVVYGSDWNGGVSPSSAPGTAHVEIEVVSLSGTPVAVDNSGIPTQLPYMVDLEIEKDGIFQNKFPRFSYRYKYADGEYSTFAPWSEIAFIPSNFNYEAKKGWNTGMINQLVSVKFKGFVPSSFGQPLGQDVTEVDILYKEEGTPNVYVVETISPLDITPPGTPIPWYAGGGTGEYEITSETIKNILPSNQLLRPWDNVPKKALAQDISGNRIVYANYEQHYDLILGGQKFKPQFKNYLGSWGDIQEGKAIKSIKSLRDYKLGVVFTDEYGRETPILISKSGGFKVEKGDSINANRLVAGLEGVAPGNMAYFKFFVKETSNEYYNLPMDRWYDADDGNIWIAFPSQDRNKVDLETFLYFKKGDDAIRNTTKYKILAIENEAPEFIKTRRLRVGGVKHNTANLTSLGVADPIHLMGAAGAELLGAPQVGTDVMVLNYGGIGGGLNPVGFATSSLSHLDEVTEDLYIQFVLDANRSGQYLVSEITSDRNDLGGVLPTRYNITVDTTFKDDINFIFDAPGDSASAIQDFVKIQFTKAVVENKPKFDGRFFAKIENDGKIKTQISSDSTGQNYITTASKMIYVLNKDSDLVNVSVNAHFSDKFADRFNYNFGTMNYFTNINLVRHDYKYWVDWPQRGPLDLNPNGQNFNFLYARQSYFGCALFDEEGPAEHNDSFENAMQTGDWSAILNFTGGATARVRGGSKVGLPVGVWFIDKSTLKYKVPEGGYGGVNLPWTYNDKGSMNRFSPAISKWSGSNSPVPWYQHSHLGTGISDNAGDGESVVKLAFGGIDNVGIYKNFEKDEDDSGGWHDKHHDDMGLQDFFAIGTDDAGAYGNYGDAGMASFVNKVNPGQKFRWKNDPTETIYTIDNQISSNNNVRFSRYDDGHDYVSIINSPYYDLKNNVKLISDPSSYHKSWQFNVVPDMTHWNPAGDLGWASMSSGLHLQDIKISITAPTPTNVYPMDNATPGINTIWVDTIMSTCVNNTEKPLHSLHKGMMLTGYNGVGGVFSNAPDDNVIIKSIGLYDSNIGGHLIELTGYYEPIHYNGADFDGTPFNPGENLEFRQVTMNGASGFTETSTDFWNTHWTDINETAPAGGIGAVGYEMLMLDFFDEYGDGGNLPPDPYVWETEPKDSTELDIYYEISENNPITLSPSTIVSAIPIGSRIESPSGLGSGWVSSVVSDNTSITGDTITFGDDQGIGAWIGPGAFGPLADGSYLQPIGQNDTLKITKPNGVSFEVKISQVIPDSNSPTTSKTFVLQTLLYNSNYHLNWHNCYSFGNGVESNRIKDNFNLPYILNGVKVSTTLGEEYKQERRKHGLIYSGIYNSTSGVNNLNQFIAAEAITKDINPIYGSIQKIKAGWGAGGDLIALCEDRVLKILADKDALFNADGNTNVTATNRVLGTATPYSGEYGISTNPESFASESYRAYFTDKVRGTVMRLSRDGLTPISDAGMKDWFRDNLKLNNKLVGSFDDKKDEYNISLPTTTEGISKTASFREDVKGWVSFKSFITKNGISCANEYYTFKDAKLWRHHHDVPGNRNTFYSIATSSTFNVLLNHAPDVVKSFYTLNYEGSDSRVTQNVLDDQYHNLTANPGWYVDSIFTNKETGDIYEFIEKEGKWFNYIRGKNIEYNPFNSDVDVDTFDEASFAIQGLGALGGVSPPPVTYGCMDATATNYDATATIDDGTCVYPASYPGCMEPDSGDYMPIATYEDGTCTWTGCNDPSAFNPYTFSAAAQAYDILYPGAIISSGCVAIVNGCTDPTAFNYDPTANTDDSSCIPVIEGCSGQNNVLATQASNYDATANTDNGSCIFSYCDDPLDTNGDDNNYNLLAMTESTGYIFDTGNYPSAGVTTTDCTSGGCTDPTAFNSYDNNATWDDGSCAGCTDPNACNFNPNILVDDGLCEAPCDWDNCGLNDPMTAYHTNASNAGINNGTITATTSDFGGFQMTDYVVTIGGVVGTSVGTNATRWYSLTPGTYTVLLETTIPGNTCTFEIDITIINTYTYPGCMDNTTIDGNGLGNNGANNYDPTAQTDDGSCTYTTPYGCWACGANGTVINPIYYDIPANDVANVNFAANGNACAYSPDAVNAGALDGLDAYSLLDNPGGSGIWQAVNFDQYGLGMLDTSATCGSGCPDSGASNFDPLGTWDYASCIWVVYGNAVSNASVDACQVISYAPAANVTVYPINLYGGEYIDDALCACCNDNSTLENIEDENGVIFGAVNGSDCCDYSGCGCSS